jgi:hypothetical protein
MIRLLLSVLIYILLPQCPAFSQQKIEWEDVATDFARSLKPLRAAAATGFPGIQNDISNQLVSSSKEFARTHADGSFNTVDMLQSAAHSSDGLVSHFAINCLVQLNDPIRADPILLKWLEDGSYQVAMAMSYLPPERARPLLAQALRVKQQTAPLSLLAIIGTADDLKLLRELESRQPKSRPARGSGGFEAPFGASLDPDYGKFIADLDHQLKLPKAQQADWQRQELLFFRASQMRAGFESEESDFYRSARLSRERGDTYTSEFLQRKLGGPDRPDAYLAAALAGEFDDRSLAPDLKRLVARHSAAARIAEDALNRWDRKVFPPTH